MTTFSIQDANLNWVDITPYIAHGGLKWSRNDVDGANAGRTQDGTMERDRVAIKYRWDVTCRPLTASEQATLLTLINDQYFLLEYTDPVDNAVKTAECYSNNFPSTYLIQYPNGTEYWNGLAFPVIMR